jgi:hypothetical protein
MQDGNPKTFLVRRMVPHYMAVLSTDSILLDHDRTSRRETVHQRRLVGLWFADRNA